jgi:hypothetical protein
MVICPKKPQHKQSLHSSEIAERETDDTVGGFELISGHMALQRFLRSHNLNHVGPFSFE